ncbi:hypothetical protein QBC38DRAFT_507611 [Podospora fimiseda]|uniref:Zn(2)-C6 fungal-type domain-containing protein n=1 Tax=Podospora fimiseda TaxID=252190 RepID=A0AAN7BVN7_9PEZI|nr:hypothetical protein QBC38DRAFT_507611 [Podospora fimiseda]
MFPCLESCFEPWGHTPLSHLHHNHHQDQHPPLLLPPPFGQTVGTPTGLQTLVVDHNNHWHFDTLIPTGLKAEALHNQGSYPRSFSGLPPLEGGSSNFISQPYDNSRSELSPPLLLNAAEIEEIIKKRVAAVSRKKQQKKTCVVVGNSRRHRRGSSSCVTEGIRLGAMSDPPGPSHPPGRPRAERLTTSCGECRRRKQKCNQGQPCSNCARRYPQPACEYKPSSRFVPYFPLPSFLCGFIYERRRRSSAVAASARPPSFSISVVPPPESPFPAAGSLSPYPPTSRHPSPLSASSSSPWPRSPGEEQPLTGWPGYDVSPRGQQQQQPPPPQQRQQRSPSYAWSTDPNLFLSHLLSCEEGCKSHSASVHEAARTLAGYSTVTSPWASGWDSSGGGAWGSRSGSRSVPWGSGPVTTGTSPISPGLMSPPAPPRMQDGELFGIYINLIAQFKASIDGNPDSSNPFIRFYVPYCIQSPLLQRIAVYTAACFLSDTGHLDRTAAMAYKGQAIELLNKHLHSQLSTSDEGVAGVIQLIIDEWHWGNQPDLEAHLRGLREMIKIRGGFRTLGLHGLISKLAITLDSAVSISYEQEPYLTGAPEFDFPDNSRIPLRLPLNTPFLTNNLPSFADCDEALRIHPSVASILDDMRFLLNAVLTLPDQPSEKELTKVHTTAGWIHERILSLPADGPKKPVGSSSSPLLPITVIPEQLEQQQELPMSRNRSIALRHLLHQQRQAIISPAPGPAESSFGENAEDYIYQAVRLAALLYSRAILQRKPFSEVVERGEFMQLWTTTWKVSLNTWRGLLGVFVWVLVPLVCVVGKEEDGDGDGDRRDGRYVKGLVNLGLVQIGMENWEICRGVMGGGGGLIRWLGGGNGNGEGEVERASGVEEGEGKDKGKNRESFSGEEEKGRGKEVIG